MAIETYPDQLEPENQDAVIWRFMDMKKFRDLIVSGALYFCRADLFSDDTEGLPPEEYLPVLGHNPLDVRDRQELNNSIGSIAQFREAYYISCWHLFREETCKMWEEYGSEGVAVCSGYRLLKAALDAMDEGVALGQVRYGSKHLTGWNTWRFITTKRIKFEDEREVRALLWITDPLAGLNRHIDIDHRVHPRPLTPPPDRVPRGQKRKMDLQALITEIVVTPWASSTTLDEVNQLVRSNGYEIPVRCSELTRYREFLPSYPASTII